MPAYERDLRFRREYESLAPAQQRAFLSAVRTFVVGLRRGRLDSRLPVKRVQNHPDVWELSWSPNGRATFTSGAEMRPGDPHSMWRRIGGHEIFREPQGT